MHIKIHSNLPRTMGVTSNKSKSDQLICFIQIEKVDALILRSFTQSCQTPKELSEFITTVNNHNLVQTQVEIISDPNYLVRILFER